jgi:predicted PhzF superfamily epimerase YddE/YHI9
MKLTPLTADLIEAMLALFGYDQGNLDPRIPSAIAEAGATHLAVTLESRERLATVLMI